MKSLKFAKRHAPELVFLLLIAGCFYVYFIAYRTTSRDVWYEDTLRQMVNMFDKITDYKGR
jgi:hypothetical protein